MKGSDNTEGSALDSPYLLSAMGVNNNKPGIAKNYIPGYSVATNPIVRTLNSAEEASEPVCNYILSPVAMYTSQIVDLTIDAAGAATFGLTSLAKWIAKKTLATVTSELLKYAVGDTVKGILKELAVNMLTSIMLNIRIWVMRLVLERQHSLQADLWDRCYRGLK